MSLIPSFQIGDPNQTRRLGFVGFIKIANVERLVTNLCTIWVGSFRLHANIARFQRKPLNQNTSQTSKKQVNKHCQGEVLMEKVFNWYAGSFASAVKKGTNLHYEEWISKTRLVLDDSCLNQSDVSTTLMGKKKYDMELLKRAYMLNFNPTRILVDTESKLVPEGTHISDPTLYRSLIGGLQYLTFTHHDLSYGTLEFGLQLYASLGSSLMAYFDIDWRQLTLSCSSEEAEYQGVANVVVETAWLRNLLRELYTPLLTANLVYYDNVGAVYLSDYTYYY
ncbi:ribonuclease H-like domain-containing protein [Tanacetum coccineum]